jgi:hypothetical protein
MKKILLILPLLLYWSCEDEEGKGSIVTEPEPEPECSVQLCCCVNVEDFVYSHGDTFHCDQTFTNTGDRNITRIDWKVEFTYSDFHIDVSEEDIRGIRLPPGESVTDTENIRLLHAHHIDDLQLSTVTNITRTLQSVTCE